MPARKTSTEVKSTEEMIILKLTTKQQAEIKALAAKPAGTSYTWTWLWQPKDMIIKTSNGKKLATLSNIWFRFVLTKDQNGEMIQFRMLTISYKTHGYTQEGALKFRTKYSYDGGTSWVYEENTCQAVTRCSSATFGVNTNTIAVIPTGNVDGFRVNALSFGYDAGTWKKCP